ncbi:MAG: hypothetical protein ROO76_10565 [Terriglobia bacterium]|nr:hypothetical protein [Terriglobia bacterium]
MKDSSAWPLMQACKDISREIIYRSDEVLEVELLGRQVIQDLLSVFWDGAVTGGKDIAHKEFSGKAYLLMSSNYRHVFERALEKIKSGSSPFPEQYCRLQLVCDYVGGMTDSFAVMLHKRLKNG